MPTHREIRLRTRPERGLPAPEHLALVQTDLPVPAPGEVLVRNRWFAVSAAVRTLIGGGLKGAPFPPLEPGDPLVGAAVGEVVSAPDDSGLRPGDLVSHWHGWREYAAVPAAGRTPLGDSLPDPVAHLSQGRTAYAALTRGTEVRAGDTVLVTGGAGAVGTMAGQIARLLGAGRVIGSTGSPAKAERLVTELGYDAVVVRGAPASFPAQLAEAAPEGVDVLLDTVGGEQLSAAVAAARPGARAVLVGALSGQLDPEGTGATARVELDSYPLVLKRVSLRGFSPLDHPETEAEWRGRFGDWLRAGEITFPHVRVAGMDRAAEALREVMEGRHLGTVVVELP
ncbi:MDR family NADP-dependent oxidoreductase [Streptomyces vietnamensis]|uniref:Alcohol dehydrogenase n=1 Tax=Streptomyces vietnamensis TaxID=362257 RepID=A0A0B5I7N5_9ACTN|nr:NADP-dependent oxidoreductase [Streptomyces vietnamensis]AJF64254.1 alcohol dehydrogenase [Streptomyces vietnamensis]